MVFKSLHENVKKNHDDGRIAQRGNSDSLLFFSNMCAEQYYLKKSYTMRFYDTILEYY